MTGRDYSAGYDKQSGMYLAVLSWQPWAKMRPRISKSVKGRNPRTHQDPTDAEAEQRTRFALMELAQAYPDVFPMRHNVRMRVRFHRQSRQIVDADNLFKHLCDAAQGVLFVNDAQVTDFHVTLDLDSANPRTELAVGTDSRSTMIRHYP